LVLADAKTESRRCLVVAFGAIFQARRSDCINSSVSFFAPFLLRHHLCRGGYRWSTMRRGKDTSYWIDLKNAAL